MRNIIWFEICPPFRWKLITQKFNSDNICLYRFVWLYFAIGFIWGGDFNSFYRAVQSIIKQQLQDSIKDRKCPEWLQKPPNFGDPDPARQVLMAIHMRLCDRTNNIDNAEMRDVMIEQIEEAIPELKDMRSTTTH